jgi:CDP-diacylglycerol--serine O-phosphatidyltransferase
MVSNAPFYSFKDINLKKSVPFIFVIGIVLLFVLVSSDPPVVLFSLFLLYGMSGYVLWLWRWRRGGTPPWQETAGAEAADDDPDDAGEVDEVAERTRRREN